ncbi:MAG: hypothetical protein GXY03_04695 [Solirubrobacterales bacterium]|nr:hypothetical protein [Solirubrobacterales bacterium]
MQQKQQGRLSLQTLVIASLASAAAAAITSQFWIRGTPIAAALSPIIVALVSELLHRPTDKLAERLTSETDALPEAAGAGPPPASQETDPRPAGEQPRAAGDAADRPDFNVYRGAGRSRRRKIAWITVLGTGLLGFLIAATLLTIPEAITGQSLFNDRRTTLGGSKRAERQPATAPTTTQTTPAETETVTETTTTPAPPTETETVTTPAPTVTERAPPATTAPDASAAPAE